VTSAQGKNWMIEADPYGSDAGVLELAGNIFHIYVYLYVYSSTERETFLNG
jgi:hypothetical protein